MENIEMATIFYTELGKLLRLKREGANLSLDDVVAYVNSNSSDSTLTKNGLALIEKGEQRIHVFQLVEISNTLKFSVAEFLDELKRNIQSEIHPELKKHL